MATEGAQIIHASIKMGLGLTMTPDQQIATIKGAIAQLQTGVINGTQLLSAVQQALQGMAAMSLTFPLIPPDNRESISVKIQRILPTVMDVASARLKVLQTVKAENYALAVGEAFARHFPDSAIEVRLIDQNAQEPGMVVEAWVWHVKYIPDEDAVQVWDVVTVGPDFLEIDTAEFDEYEHVDGDGDPPS